MLDIEYIKQIDEVLEVQDFTVQEHKCITYLWHLNRGFDFNYSITENCEYKDTFYKTIYPLYLQRVIEAINKKFYNDDDFFFRVDQDYESLTVIEGCIGVEDFNTFNGKIDEAKEKAIEFVMDHIKEKV